MGYEGAATKYHQVEFEIHDHNGERPMLANQGWRLFRLWIAAMFLLSEESVQVHEPPLHKEGAALWGQYWKPTKADR